MALAMNYAIIIFKTQKDLDQQRGELFLWYTTEQDARDESIDLKRHSDYEHVLVVKVL